MRASAARPRSYTKGFQHCTRSQSREPSLHYIVLCLYIYPLGWAVLRVQQYRISLLLIPTPHRPIYLISVRCIRKPPLLHMLYSSKRTSMRRWGLYLCFCAWL